VNDPDLYELFQAPRTDQLKSKIAARRLKTREAIEAKKKQQKPPEEQVQELIEKRSKFQKVSFADFVNRDIELVIPPKLKFPSIDVTKV